MKNTEAKKTKKRLRESTETSKARIFHKKTEKIYFYGAKKVTNIETTISRTIK